MTKVPKFQLGQRVRYRGYMHRGTGKWERYSLRKDQPCEGIIVGKRTCTDGYTDTSMEYNLYRPTRYHQFWLVAHNLSGYRYVVEADIVAVEQAMRDGTDGYEWHVEASKI